MENSNKNKLFLSVESAKKLGINNLENQDVYLNNKKLNVFSIADFSQEKHLSKQLIKTNNYVVGYADKDYLASLDDLSDNLEILNSKISSLDDYQRLVHTKTREYLIDRKIWTNKSLDAFLGDEYYSLELSEEQIKELNSLYDLWIYETEFNTKRIRRQIYKLLQKTKKFKLSVYEYEQFYNNKATIESNLDIVQILIYLKTLLLDTANKKGYVLEGDSTKLPSVSIDDLEYVPFSFQQYEYQKRRNFIKNSSQWVDGEFDDENYVIEEDEKQEEDVVGKSSKQKQTQSILQSQAQFDAKLIKIAELKQYDDTKLTFEQRDQLEKEFYALGPINTYDDLHEDEHQIVDIEHAEDEKYNHEFNPHKDHSKQYVEDVEIKPIEDLRVGTLLERKYRRHHESPMIVDIENKVDFLLAGYEALDDNDPEVLLRNEQYARQQAIEEERGQLEDLEATNKKKKRKNEFKKPSTLVDANQRLIEIKNENGSFVEQKEIVEEKVVKSQIHVSYDAAPNQILKEPQEVIESQLDNKLSDETPYVFDSNEDNFLSSSFEEIQDKQQIEEDIFSNNQNNIEESTIHSDLVVNEENNDEKQEVQQYEVASQDSMLIQEDDNQLTNQVQEEKVEEEFEYPKPIHHNLEPTFDEHEVELRYEQLRQHHEQDQVVLNEEKPVVEDLKQEIVEDVQLQKENEAQQTNQFIIDDYKPTDIEDEKFTSINELDSFAQYFNKENDLLERNKVSQADFENKTDELNEETLKLVDELSAETNKKKKKSWFSFKKKNKDE